MNVARHVNRRELCDVVLPARFRILDGGQLSNSLLPLPLIPVGVGSYGKRPSSSDGGVLVLADGSRRSLDSALDKPLVQSLSLLQFPFVVVLLRHPHGLQLDALMHLITHAFISDYLPLGSAARHSPLSRAVDWRHAVVVRNVLV